MIRRLTKFPVKRLEHIFPDVGLPLVAKSSPDLHTTSILVRGGPGTGKTTLALALGQAIAADGGGVLVYLTTEFSPAEIRFKADLLRFEARNTPIYAWDGTRSPGAQAPVGTVFVHHVSTPPGTEEPELQETETTSASKKLSILASAWRLLGVDDGETPPSIAGMPVRALVIDAFILPDYGGDDAAVRTDLVAFIQALETLGVTPVIVEEVAPRSPSWFPFVVDLVFELSHEKMPERGGEWGRTLTCTKSRYALVSAGPHTYSLSEGAPALFPTIRHAASGIPKVADPLRFAVPDSPDPTLWHVVEGHQVVLTPFGTEDGMNAVLAVAGARKVEVRFGFPCQITASDVERTVDESEGPSALAWSILDVVTACRANLVVLTSISRVVQHESWQSALGQLLDAFRHLGLVVLVYDEEAALKPFAPMADISVTLRNANTEAGRYPRNEIHLFARQPRRRTFSPRPYVLRLMSPSPSEDKGVEFFVSTLVGKLRPIRPSPEWQLACAWVAGNAAAFDPLERLILGDLRAHASLAVPVIRARAKWEGVTAAEDCARRLLTSFLNHAPESTPRYQRVRAELRLDSEDSATVHEGITLLLDLVAHDRLPAYEKAEVYYNLAVALDAVRDRAGSDAALSQSLELNPGLDPALRLQRSRKK